MSLGGDVAADLFEMHLHGGGVSEGKHERGPLAEPGTDGPEEIGIVVALIGGQAGTRAGLGPNSRAAILLPQPGFVLKPNFDALALGQRGYVAFERAREVFLKASITRSSCLGCCGRAEMCENDRAASRLEIPRSL